MRLKTEKKELVWQEERRTMTLEGEPVLELDLSWPRTGEKRIDRYYARVCELWKEYWKQEGHRKACEDLAEQRAKSLPFRVWRASLSGQVLLDGDGLLSISMLAREVQGDGRMLEYRWGDTWGREDGRVVTLKELIPVKRGWRKELIGELERAAEACRGQGVYLDKEVKKPLRQWFSQRRFALTGEGLEFYYPQCTLAPAVEGAVVLRVPLPKGDRPGKKDA